MGRRSAPIPTADGGRVVLVGLDEVSSHDAVAEAVDDLRESEPYVDGDLFDDRVRAGHVPR